MIGHDFSFTLLQAISGLSEDDLRALLDDLQAAEFLYTTQLFPDLHAHSPTRSPTTSPITSCCSSAAAIPTPASSRPWKRSMPTGSASTPSGLLTTPCAAS